MKRIGILLCEVFEEELLNIIANNNRFDRVIVVDNESSKYFQEKLEKILTPDKRKIARELCSKRFLKREYPLELIIYILPFCLHTSPEQIQNEVIEASKELERHVDKLILFYGLCGNSLGDIEKLLKNNRIKVPVSILVDDEGNIVEDCICALLGSKEEYANELYKEGGTWFMTIGWARHWDKIAEERAELLGQEYMKELEKKLGIEKLDGLENLKIIFDHTKYKRLLALELGFEDEDYNDKCKDFASCLNLSLEYKKGTMRILEKAIDNSLKDLL